MYILCINQLIMARVIKFVMESAAEAEIASLFINAKAAISIRKKYTNRNQVSTNTNTN